MLIINPPTGTELFTLTGENEQTGRLQVVDGARSHPLATFLNVSNVSLRVFQNVTVGSWAEPIIESQGGAIIYAGEDDGRQIILMPFDLLNSDLPLQIAWPLLMSNAMEWFSPANIVSGGTSYSVGDLVRVNPPLDSDTVRVTTPDGRTQNLDMTGDNISFADTHRPGLYTIEVLTAEVVTDTQTIAVNIFGAEESDIAPIDADTLQVGGRVTGGDADEQLGFREYWPLFAAIALAVLMLEWYVYFRRLRIPEETHVDLRRTTARQ